MFYKLIRKFIKALKDDSNPSEIAGGAVIGLFLGLTPFFALHNLILLLFLFILKVNISAAIFMSIMFGFIGYAVDPLSHILGERFLMSNFLEGFWVFLYNTPLLAFARLNNTVILGSLVISALLSPVIFIFSRKFVLYYRSTLKQKVDKMKVTKILKASKIYKTYVRFKQ